MSLPSLLILRQEVRELSDPKKAKVLQWFFKTGPGQYGHGDVFLGLTVPVCRKLAIKFSGLDLVQVKKLLASKYHEERLIALLILVHKFDHGSSAEQRRVYDLYLRSVRYVNNWDLVDLSADKIVGAYLLQRPRAVLRKMSASKDLWQRRIAIVSTFQFIKHHEFKDTLKLASILLDDEHDLIHKAVGWMLREVGKRNITILERWLRRYYHRMPRTMLRYAIERFPESKRLRFLEGKM